MAKEESSVALKQRRDDKVSEMESMIAHVAKEGRDFNSEERELFDSLDREQEALGAQADMQSRKERLQSLRSQGATVENSEEVRSALKGYRPQAEQLLTGRDYNHAFKGWLNHRFARQNPAQFRAAADKVGFDLNHDSFMIEYRDQDLTNSKGGYAIGQWPMAPLTEALKAWGGMLNVADVHITSGGNPFPWPITDDTSVKGEILGVNTEVDVADQTYSQMVLNAFTYSSKAIKLPKELIADASFDILGLATRQCGVRLGRAINDDLTIGDTSGNNPRGIVTDATVGVTTASASAIAWQELEKLIHSVDPLYRQGAKVGFMMNDQTLYALKTLADNQNRPLFVPSLSQGAPSTYAGFPIYINQSMATISASSKPVLFGDFSYYKVRQQEGVELEVCRELFANYHQIAVFGYMRLDGRLVFASGSCPVKALQMAGSGSG
jgi:HK97 family phage major capsid protein